MNRKALGWLAALLLVGYLQFMLPRTAHSQGADAKDLKIAKLEADLARLNDQMAQLQQAVADQRQLSEAWHRNSNMLGQMNQLCASLVQFKDRSLQILERERAKLTDLRRQLGHAKSANQKRVITAQITSTVQSSIKERDRLWADTKQNIENIIDPINLSRKVNLDDHKMNWSKTPPTDLRTPIDLDKYSGKSKYIFP